MPSYSNGYIPEDLLVIFARGANTVDGAWYHALSPATYARHKALVRVAYNRTGRTLEISDGFGAYRPMAAQWVARNIYGTGAAWPGTSSHGGFWEERQTLAVDYANWSWVYGGDRGLFYEDCRSVGLVPGMISPERGYPDEPWHVIDLSPWAMPAYGDATDFPTSPELSEPDPIPTEEEDEMNITLYVIADPAGIDGNPDLKAKYILAGPGYYVELVTADAANLLAKKFNRTGPVASGAESAVSITYAERDALKAAASSQA